MSTRASTEPPPSGQRRRWFAPWRRRRPPVLLRLSELAHRPATDPQGRRLPVLDFAVDLAAGDYPPVQHLVVRTSAADVGLVPWDGQTGPRRDLRVQDLAVAEPLDAAALAQHVLLRRDIQDALVLDVPGQRAVRANDLWLRRDEQRLTLVGADISPWAVVRRLSRGLLGHGAEQHILDWQGIEFLRGDPRAAVAGRDYHRVIAALTPGQVAILADALPYPHAAELLSLLPDTLAADVLERMAPRLQAQVTAALEPLEAARLLTLMADYIAADVLGQLELPDATQLLELMPQERSVVVQALLRFPPESAGGIMTTEMVTAPAGLTVGQTLEHVRGRLLGPDFFAYVYLIGDEPTGRLCGVVSLRHLVASELTTPIEQVMRANLQTIGPLEPALLAAQRIAELDVGALPVTGADGRLLGIITVDAAMDQITPESWRDSMPRVFS